MNSISELEQIKKVAFDHWMDAIERRLTASEEEESARKEYIAAEAAIIHLERTKAPISANRV